MKLCIKNIATIKSGITLRSKLETSPDSNVAMIQLRNLSSDYESINYDALDRVKPSFVPEKYYLNGNEILFVAKGSRNRAFVVDKSSMLNLAASATFFILEPDLDILIPEFLAWSLNQPTAQSYFDSIRTGTSTQNINKKALADMELDIPAIEKQKHIVHVAQLFRNELRLREKLMEKRTAYITAILNQYSHE